MAALEEVLSLPDPQVQTRLAKLPDAIVAGAMRAGPRALAEKIARNLSERRREAIAEALRMAAADPELARKVVIGALLDKPFYRRYLDNVPAVKAAKRVRADRAAAEYVKRLIHERR